jgi:hypothetical protein
LVANVFVAIPRIEYRGFAGDLEANRTSPSNIKITASPATKRIYEHPTPEKVLDS